MVCRIPWRSPLGDYSGDTASGVWWIHSDGEFAKVLGWWVGSVCIAVAASEAQEAITIAEL